MSTIFFQEQKIELQQKISSNIWGLIAIFAIDFWGKIINGENGKKMFAIMANMARKLIAKMARMAKMARESMAKMVIFSPFSP